VILASWVPTPRRISNSTFCICIDILKQKNINTNYITTITFSRRSRYCCSLRAGPVAGPWTRLQGSF